MALSDRGKGKVMRLRGKPGGGVLLLLPYTPRPLPAPGFTPFLHNADCAMFLLAEFCEFCC
jgi:hypothetical protein